MKLLSSFAISRVGLSLVLAVLSACILVGINEIGYGQSTQALDRINEYTRNRNSLNRLLQQVLDAETGSRGYLLTGDPRYLEPYNAAVHEIGQSLETLRRTYTLDATESVVVAQLTRSVQHKLAEMEVSVRLRKQGNEDAWKFVLMTDIGKEHMDFIRSQAGKLIQSATEGMETARGQVEESLRFSRLGIALVAFAGLLAFYLYLRQSIRLKLAGEQQQAALQQERDLLEGQVRERTASLAELATHLQQVREDERGHLARELHDELGALLTAAKLDVARLKSKLGTQAPEIATRLQHLTETLNSGIALKRRIIEDLRPSSLTNLGLTASLEILAREFSERAGIEVTTNLEPVDLDESRQLTVYRLVQESVTNVGKYAEATQVDVSVRNYGNHIEVEIRDDGKGFDARATRSSTRCRIPARTCVEAAGGKLTVTSRPGMGTRIAAVMPAQALQSTPTGPAEAARNPVAVATDA